MKNSRITILFPIQTVETAFPCPSHSTSFPIIYAAHMTGIAANQPEKKEKIKPIYRFFLQCQTWFFTFFLASYCPVPYSHMSLPHSLIKRTVLNQLFLGSCSFYTAIFQNNDFVCICDCGKSMCNNQQCLAFCQFFNTLLNLVLIFRIRKCSRFVKDDDRCIFQRAPFVFRKYSSSNRNIKKISWKVIRNIW